MSIYESFHRLRIIYLRGYLRKNLKTLENIRNFFGYFDVVISVVIFQESTFIAGMC